MSVLLREDSSVGVHLVRKYVHKHTVTVLWTKKNGVYTTMTYLRKMGQQNKTVNAYHRLIERRDTMDIDFDEVH